QLSPFCVVQHHSSQSGGAKRPHTEHVQGRTGRKMSKLLSEIDGVLFSQEVLTKSRKRARKKNDQAAFRDAVAALICDLTHCVLTGHTAGIVLSRSNAYLTTRSRYRPAFIGKTLPDILDLMSDPKLSFITQEIGCREELSKKGKLTKVWPGPTLERLIREREIHLEDIRYRPPTECIILKSTKESYWDQTQVVPCDDTPDTHRMRSELELINDWLGRVDIRFDESLGQVDWTVDAQDRCLRRIFTRNSFTSGGRLFGGFWQSLKKQHRYGIFIDGEPVAELDYGQIAPRLLYGLAGVEPPEGDLYAIPELANEADPESCRNGIKKLFNSILFMEKHIASKPRGAASLLPKRYSAPDLVQMLKGLHPGIASYFETGIGHHLQCLESQVQVEVLTDLRKLGVVALPLHDAILVPRSRRYEADSAMAGVFMRQSGLNAIVEHKPWYIEEHTESEISSKEPYIIMNTYSRLIHSR
ncbi:hypothetical protein, partial [Methylobacterium nigriterrae]|uniref:hypothetical protein n=1 Tax=Methylobacterium nigriterrae TaxID=3127512 RepID=UPI003013766D